MIPERFIEELKYRSDIEQVISSYVPLKRTGRNLKGLCPFHSEKTPSFTVYPENQSFYCFGCGAGGDVVTFIRKIENLEYVEALRFLAQRAGMTLPEEARDDGTFCGRRYWRSTGRAPASFSTSWPTGRTGGPSLTCGAGASRIKPSSDLGWDMPPTPLTP